MQPSQEMERLSREMFDTVTRRSPSWATDLGIHTWDHEVGDPSKARLLEDIGLHQGWLQRADKIAKNQKLNAAERVDVAALQYTLRLWLYEEQELRSWARNPDLAMEFLDHVFGLLVKDELPLEQRCQAIAARLDKAPRFLDAGRDRFVARDCPQLWVDMALESVDGSPAMLEAARQMAAQASPQTREHIASASKRAGEAFQAHKDWLQELRKQAIPDGWAIGGPRFDHLVGLRALGANADEILARGNQLVVQLREDTRRAAAAVAQREGQQLQGDVVAQAQGLIEAQHPKDWAAVLQSYRDSIHEARAFVERSGLATLPPGERLEVIETPSYLRHILPFAAYISPGKFERKQTGIYLVTPREPKGFPAAEVLNTTVHEGYPGHHLQLSGANQNPSLARLFVHATESIEGWAHYCEDLMLGKGFAVGGASKEAIRYVVLKDQLWRACRIVIDVKIHRGTMSFDQGWQMLRDVARIEEPQARAELKRYTQSPAYQLSYLWGKIQIQNLHDAAHARGMTEREFHDRYIQAGSLPLGLMRQALGLV